MASSNDDVEQVFSVLGREETPDIIRDKKMSECFRRVFSSQDGRIVLHQLLTDLKFYDECISDADVALNNFAKFMIFKRLKVNNSKEITSLIMDIESNLI